MKNVKDEITLLQEQLELKRAHLKDLKETLPIEEKKIWKEERKQ